jgi:hypothetical protein
MAGSTRAHLVWSSGGSFFGSCGNVVIAHWTGAPTARQLRRLAEHCEAVSAAHGGAALLNLVTAGASSLDADARAQALALTRSNAAGNLGVAHVVLLEGLAGVAVRGLFLAILSLSKPRTPTATFGTLEEGVAWLAPYAGARASELRACALEWVALAGRAPAAGALLV